MQHPSAKHILVAVDGSDNSRRAVEHVAEILAGARDFRFTLLHVVAEPDPDYFGNNPAKQLEWVEAQRTEAGRYMEEYARILTEARITPELIAVEVREKRCPSLAQCILDECSQHGAGVLVLGRQGRGAREELLMGSVSKAAVHNSKGRAVWVVT
jgi:nucleotide-binding universal stress UspA family protein